MSANDSEVCKKWLYGMAYLCTAIRAAQGIVR